MREFSSEDEWLAYESSRGELAMVPEQIECYQCGGKRTVVKLGPIAEAHRDPTQTYVLACGHTVI